MKDILDFEEDKVSERRQKRLAFVAYVVLGGIGAFLLYIFIGLLV